MTQKALILVPGYSCSLGPSAHQGGGHGVCSASGQGTSPQAPRALAWGCSEWTPRVSRLLRLPLACSLHGWLYPCLFPGLGRRSPLRPRRASASSASLLRLLLLAGWTRAVLPVNVAWGRAGLSPDVPVPGRVQTGSRPAPSTRVEEGNSRGFFSGPQGPVRVCRAGERPQLIFGWAQNASPPEARRPRRRDEGPRCAHGEPVFCPVFRSVLRRERLWEGEGPGASEPGVL